MKVAETKVAVRDVMIVANDGRGMWCVCFFWSLYPITGAQWMMMVQLNLEK